MKEDAQNDRRIFGNNITYTGYTHEEAVHELTNNKNECNEGDISGIIKMKDSENETSFQETRAQTAFTYTRGKKRIQNNEFSRKNKILQAKTIIPRSVSKKTTFAQERKHIQSVNHSVKNSK